MTLPILSCNCGSHRDGLMGRCDGRISGFNHVRLYADNGGYGNYSGNFSDDAHKCN